MKEFSENKIIDSWKKNATPWIQAIRKEEIKSRIEVTNRAIVEAVLERNPSNVLDIGCGEGWLVRTLTDYSVNCLGVDIVPELIASAKVTGNGRFKVLAYNELNFEQLDEKFDLAVCNFSLIGKESVDQLFQNIPDLLKTNGALIIQTLHPNIMTGTQSKDGWQKGSWDGFNDQFTDAAPWYFRTLRGWEKLFSKNGFHNLSIIEPTYPKTRKPASIILVAEISSTT